MSLSDYSRKRRFDKTPEPPPKLPQESSNRFCIQRHSARRLHYDLRLEVNGVLKSWAVPKGPTLDPKEKRLAVLVEDHPIEYGDFEGTIPAGNYGAGSVLLWDRGTYELLGDVGPEAQLERGDFKFKLHGEKLIGEFALVKMKNRGKGNEWLLLKKPDFAAQAGYDSEDDLRSVGVIQSDPALIPGAVKAPMPVKFAPMMAISSSRLPQGPDWVYEVKWDGVRALCFVDGKKVWAIGRSGRPIEAQYPELAAIAEQFRAKQAILDGEVVAFDENGVPSFAEIQPRIHGRLTKALQQSNPVTFFAFDLLYVDGVDLRGVALSERRRELAARLRPGGSVRLSDQFVEGAPLLNAARERGLEGVVAKRATSNYESKRSDCWVKVKVVTQQDFVICGMTSGERKPFGSLALGVYDDGELVYAGNVGSGFNDESLRTLGARLKELVVKKCPFAEVPKIPGETTWVKPEVVTAVKFMAWTKDERLRAPVFLGVRDDVSPKECIRESGDASASVDTGLRARVAVEAVHQARPSLLSGKAEEIHTIDGQQLKFTNLNKVFYPADGITKRDVINYYDAVSDLILPYLRERPLSLKRYPNGIDHDFFFQKNAAESFPSWVRTVPIESEERTIQFVVADDRATLLYLANLACIDQNPWMSRVGNLSNPDFVLIDLDPYHCGYDRIVEAAQLVRSKLELMGLQGFAKTTGGDGMHIYVPLEPIYNYEQVRSFAEIISRIVTHERPDLFTTPRTVKQREKGKVYFDYFQIREGATISAPYVLRAYPGAPVSTPLRWNEVQRGLSPQQFNVRNAPDRFARLEDLFAPVLTVKQRLESAIEKLQTMMGPPAKSKAKTKS
ncbi:MAG TPA: DNA ligase D [Terriglobales bacterium]|nr:DNA ligase D [Terriglobales bacterium]